MYNGARKSRVLSFGLVVSLFWAGAAVAQSGGLSMSKVLGEVGGDSADTKSALPVGPSAADVFFVGSINTCFRNIQDVVDPEASLKLQIDINQYGDPATILVLADGPLSDSQRAILRMTSDALVDCTPLPKGAGHELPASYTIVAWLDGLSPVEVPLVAASSALVSPVASDGDQSPSAETGTQASEKALKLSRHDRREIQRRLSLIDYDTNGIDGKFGKGTRRAIRSWQRDLGLPKSGYLNAAQVTQLKQDSAKEYAIWDAKPKRYYDKKGCLREPNGRVVLGRTTLCDLGAIFQ
jgi:hypothetical protein